MTRLALLAAALAASAGSALADAPLATAPAAPVYEAAAALTTAAPVTTAPAKATASDSGVAQQIDDFIRSSPVALPDDHASGVISGRPEPFERKIQSVVSVGVGTGGYRSLYAQSEMPLGKTGTLSIAVADVKGRGAYWGEPYMAGGPYLARGPRRAFGYGGDYGRAERRSIDIGLSLGDQRACRGRYGEREPQAANSYMGSSARACEE